MSITAARAARWMGWSWVLASGCVACLGGCGGDPPVAPLAPDEANEPEPVVDAPRRIELVEQTTPRAERAPSLRPLAPASGSRVHLRRPTFRWQTPAGERAQVELCRDRACEDVIARVEGEGEGAPSADLPLGVVHWRVVGSGSPSATWRVVVRPGAPGAITGTRGDLDGDGFADVVVGARGRDGHPTGYARIYRGSADGLVVRHAAEVDDQVLQAVAPEYGQRFASARGDVDGDGREDLLIARPELARVDVLRAFEPGLQRHRASSLPWPEPRPTNLAVTAADVDGDGFDDVIVGRAFSHRLLVFRGGTDGPTQTPTTFTWSTDDRDTTHLGDTVANVGDVDADGDDDVVVASSGQGFVDLGNAWLVRGSPEGLAWDTRERLPNRAREPQEPALPNLASEPPRPRFGIYAAPLGVFFADALGEAFGVARLGEVELFAVGRDGQVRANSYVGAPFVGGDFDGNGRPDLAVSEPGSVRVTNCGDVELFHRGQRSFGTGLAVPGDVDGDGYDDLAVTVPPYFGADPLLLIYYGGAECVERSPRTVVFGEPWGDRGDFGWWVR